MKLETKLKIIANEMRTAIDLMEDSWVREGLTKEEWRTLRDEFSEINAQLKYLSETVWQHFNRKTT